MPFWAKTPSGASKQINARLETVAVKPSFRSAFRYRRCLIPAEGFFEWDKTGDQKQPWFITLPSKQPFAFAGLWETWNNGKAATIYSCTILTTAASRSIEKIHQRMPVILPSEMYADWLNPDITDLKQLESRVRQRHLKDFAAQRVSKYVNSPRNNDPKCIEPIETT
ncbi:MAG: SOS response-associated peptidase [Deltaproteobacteria bacterium]|nr:SOS response-associated peptidase [Deltaproteobacteria bacterium]